jgi:hypothetical protein
MAAQHALDPELLDSYAKRFLGYGNTSAPFWFIGLEHGGGGNADEIHQRLTAWDQRGRRSIEDLFDYHVAIAEHRWFATRSTPRLQRTWAQLVRVVLAARGKSTDNAAVRDYQAHSLGRSTGETCLLECSALPSPNLTRWLLPTLTELPHLQSREIAYRVLVPDRLRLIRGMIDEHKPHSVVCYGSRPQWLAVIAGQTLTPVGGLMAGRRGPTRILVVRHPTARWKTGEASAYFSRVGEALNSAD